MDETQLIEPNSGRLLTAKDVAAMLAVPTSWVYAQSRAGNLPTVPCGRYRRYRPAAIQAWIARAECDGDGIAATERT
jgi:predicted DNA-binding transcriptional regulator AlpA